MRLTISRGYFYKGVGKLHAWTEKNVLEISSSNSSLSIRQIEISDFSLFMRIICNACQVETGFWTDSEPLRFEKAAWKGAFCPLCLHPPSHPSVRPSVRPGGVRSALGPHAEHELACMQKRRKAAQRSAGSSRLCSRSEQLHQHQQTTNSDLFKASPPPGGIFWTNSHCLQRTGLRSALQNFTFSSR